MPNRFYSSTSVTTSLSGTVGPSTTSITLASTVGMPGSLPYTLIIDPDTLVEEIVTVTGASGTTLTVTRGEDGTTGQAHTAGAVVVHGVSARDFREPQAHMDLTANVHGVSGTLANAASVTALAASVSGSLGGKVDKSTLAGKGYLVTATAGSTPVGLAPGADSTVLTADSSQANGVKWAAIPGATTELLFAQEFTAIADYTTSTTFVDLQGGSISASFTMPLSGRVLVRIRAYGFMAGTNTGGYMNLRTSAGNVSGTDRLVIGSDGAGSSQLSANNGQIEYAALATGTAGAATTLKVGYRSRASNSEFHINGASSATSPGSFTAPLLLEVWSA